jgi:hypothetical protein
MQGRMVIALGVLLLAPAAGCSEDNPVSGTEICDNSKDDDGDKLVDCADPDCVSCTDGGADVGSGDGGTGDGGTLPLALQAVLNTITMPLSSAEYAIDLDNNGTLDNQVGLMLGALMAVNPKLDLQKDLDLQMSQGKILSLHEVFAASLTDASTALAQVHMGQDPDGDPSNNFTGSATLGVLATGTSLPGKIAGGQLRLGPGSLTSPVIIGATHIVITLKAAVMQADISATGMTKGTIAGAIPMADVSSKLIPALAKEIDRQYKDPKITPDGKKLLHDVFDLNKDGTISAQEFGDNPIISVALKTPDVDSDGDKLKDAMSIGFGFTAVTCKISKK